MSEISVWGNYTKWFLWIMSNNGTSSWTIILLELVEDTRTISTVLNYLQLSCWISVLLPPVFDHRFKISTVFLNLSINMLSLSQPCVKTVIVYLCLLSNVTLYESCLADVSRKIVDANPQHFYTFCVIYFFHFVFNVVKSYTFLNLSCPWTIDFRLRFIILVAS